MAGVGGVYTQSKDSDRNLGGGGGRKGGLYTEQRLSDRNLKEGGGVVHTKIQ